MVKEVTDDVYWITNCEDNNSDHMHASVYLIDGNEGTILIDAGSALNESSIREAVHRLTNGSGPDVILLTHSTLPHTENVSAFKSEWGDIEVISAAGRYPETIGLPDAKLRQFDQVIRYAGRPITCIHPLLTDVTLSQWVYDHSSRVLFTAETFGHYHEVGDCELLSEEFEDGIPYKSIRRFYRDKLPYIQFLDTVRLQAALESLIDIVDIEYVAPIHGNPVHARDLDLYVEDVIQAIGAD